MKTALSSSLPFARNDNQLPYWQAEHTAQSQLPQPWKLYPMRRESSSIEKLPRSLRIQPHWKNSLRVSPGWQHFQNRRKDREEILSSRFSLMLSDNLLLQHISSISCWLLRYTLSALTGYKYVNQRVRKERGAFVSILSTWKGSLLGKSSRTLQETQKLVNKEVSARNWDMYLRNCNAKDCTTASTNR